VLMRPQGLRLGARTPTCYATKRKTKDSISGVQIIWDTIQN